MTELKNVFIVLRPSDIQFSQIEIGYWNSGIGQTSLLLTLSFIFMYITYISLIYMFISLDQEPFNKTPSISIDFIQRSSPFCDLVLKSRH